MKKKYEAEFAPLPPTTTDHAAIGELLGVLRDNGVSKWSKGPNGITVEFFPGPSPRETRDMMLELGGASAPKLPPLPKIEEPKPGPVEPSRLDLEDILPSGVQ